MPQKDAIQAYLAKFGCEEFVLAETLKEGLWEAVVVLPAYDETAENIIDVFKELCELPVLCILVLNAPKKAAPLNDSPEQVLHHLKATALDAPFPVWHAKAANVDFLIVDRFSQGREIPLKNGVGLARKIGGDIAAHAISLGLVRTPWIFSTDADATLPSNYLEATEIQEADNSAVYFPFIHRGKTGGEPSQPLALYELSLRYYTASLATNIKRTAHDTIGSALAVRATAYAEVRGFPPRSGGEDFYLIAKAAKVGCVALAKTKPVLVTERESDRVPFGTSTGTRKISQQLEARERVLFYDPRVFSCLGALEKAVASFFSNRSIDDFNRVLASNPLSQAIYAVIESTGLQHRLILADSQTKALPDLRKRVFDWFDHFRVLKMVHFLRDEYFCNIDWTEALAKSEFVRDRMSQEQEALFALRQWQYPHLDAELLH